MWQKIQAPKYSMLVAVQLLLLQPLLDGATFEDDMDITYNGR